MLVNIQFLRFAAAFMVVLYHASLHVVASGADPGPLFSAAGAAGFAGVDIFFVISGFIMFYTTTRVSGISASSEFIRRRLARIYSGYWPFFVLAALVIAWARPAQFESAGLAGSLLLWPMPLDKLLLPVSWTLSYEMYFYLLFTVLLLAGLRARSWLLIGVLATVTGFNLAQHFLFQSFAPENMGRNTFFSLFYTSPFLIEFFAGAVLASYASRGSILMGRLLLLFGIGGFALAGGANVWFYDGHVDWGYHVVPRVLMYGLPSVMLLWGLVILESNGRKAPYRFSLDTGGASYAIYLCHTIFFAITAKLGFHGAMQEWPDSAVQGFYLLYCILIVVFSVAHYRTVERWLHHQFKRLLRVSRSS